MGPARALCGDPKNDTSPRGCYRWLFDAKPPATCSSVLRVLRVYVATPLLPAHFPQNPHSAELNRERQTGPYSTFGLTPGDETPDSRVFRHRAVDGVGESCYRLGFLAVAWMFLWQAGIGIPEDFRGW
jgi:hypothetical protein